LRSPLC
jgi:DNA-binding transcriptional ArsR family regulator